MNKKNDLEILNEFLIMVANADVRPRYKVKMIMRFLKVYTNQTIPTIEENNK